MVVVLPMRVAVVAVGISKSPKRKTLPRIIRIVAPITRKPSMRKA
jgi:hypothetical protein